MRAQAPISGPDPMLTILRRAPAPLAKPQLITQVLAVNASLICGTLLAYTVAATLHAGAAPDHPGFLLFVAGVLATILANGLLLRRRFQPLERVIAAMERVDFGLGGRRPHLPEADSEEVLRLHTAFERMLDRLEAERARTATLVLRAQEEERARLARDLHDEANQALTGVLLRLQATAQDAPAALRDELRATQAVATQAMEELVRLARELRPAALDDLGLAAALRTQVDAFARRAGVQAELRLEQAAVDALLGEEQLVVYRVVQEGLSNVARHARARHVVVEAVADHGDVVVGVRDNGEGFDPSVRAGGLGLQGMRERAALAGGRVTIHSSPGRGTTVELRLVRRSRS
jgi:two-component system, NarL family, sensor histidine kinase UhpB